MPAPVVDSTLVAEQSTLHGPWIMSSIADSAINPKLPTWDGSWRTFPDYRFAAQLELDGCKTDERELLAPRLVRNLTGRAWEACQDIDRSKLKHADGVAYLLEFLREKRGKQHVDLLGDALQQYFQSNESTRKDMESLNDFEQRHAVLIRDIKKAMIELGVTNEVPSEIFGWFVLNQLMRLDPSDAAVIKAQSPSYKLEDIMTSMRKMWGGDSLAMKDAEKKKHGTGRSYLAETRDTSHSAMGVDHEDDETSSAWMNYAEGEDDEETMEESQAWFEETLNALHEDPNSAECWANFQEAKKTFYKDARRALDQSRVSRGFYPMEKGKGKGKTNSSGSGKGFTGRCMRCGKIGHKAMQCRQAIKTGSSGSGGGKGESTSGVGFVFGAMCQQEPEEPAVTYAVLEEESKYKAILDCGASESIVGAHTLQHMCDVLEDHGRDPEKEVAVDRTKHRSFLFGNNQTSNALGLAQMTAGIGGEDVKVSMHIVEGQTPLLLSSRWLWEQEAVINFASGKATFKCLGDRQIQLERASTNHLMLPINMFKTDEPGSGQLLPDDARCPAVDALSNKASIRTHESPQ